MKFNYYLCSVLFLCFSFSVISAQTSNFQGSQKTRTFIENVRFGGGLGLSFGNDFFSGTLSPFGLYEINQYLMTGVGVNLTYSSFNNSDLLVYGGSLIGLARPLPNLQFSSEFEQLRVNRSFDNESLDDNYWYPALFLGIGYTSGQVTIGIRYDVLYDEDRSIYANAYLPFVRVLF